MPHIDNQDFDIPEAHEIAPDDVMPRTPKRPQQPPLEARDKKKQRRGLSLGKVSIGKWKPDDDTEEAMANFQ
jgi:hypothetical protein